MRNLTIPKIRALDLRDAQATPPWEFVWDWPRVPAVAGRRNAMTFPPVTLQNGETLKINSVVGPFGYTVLGAEKEGK